MITLNCLGCGTTLRVDDGFAGGVCRCAKCGAMLAVPTAAGKGARKSAELSDLAEVVSSSGLARQAASRSDGAVRPIRMLLTRSPAWLALPVVAVLAVGGLALGWQLRPEGAGVDPRTVHVSKPASAFGSPTFGPVDLGGATHVVFLLDRGDATASAWPELVRKTLAGVWSLGPDREVRVGVWHGEDGSPMTPSGVASVQDRRDLARQLLAGVRVGGATELGPALDSVLPEHPSDIVLVSGKAWQVDAELARVVLAKLGGQAVRIHAISLGSVPPGEGWRMLAESTGGVMGTLDPAEPSTLTR